MPGPKGHAIVAVQTGELAPQVTLKAHTGDMVTTGGAADHIQIIAFYYFAFSGG